MKNIRKTLSLPIFLVLCQLIGVLGSLATVPALDDWYDFIDKPSWTPPDQVFAPVWILLFVLMAVAAWLVWKKPKSQERFLALTFFGIQLGLNLLWSYLFFSFENPGLAFFELMVLWFIIGITTIYFWHLRTAAGILMLPYLAWATFAAVLNFAIWRINL